MIFRKTERYYKEEVKTWLKEGSYETRTHLQVVKRYTIWFLFIPIFWYEKIIDQNM